MSDIGRPSDELAIDKHRHGEHDIVQMRDAAVVGVIGHENIARRNVLEWYEFEETFDRLVEDANKAGNPSARTDKIALCVGYTGADIEHFVDDRAHRRLFKDRKHLVRRRGEPLLNDVRRERIGGAGRRTHIALASNRHIGFELISVARRERTHNGAETLSRRNSLWDRRPRTRTPHRDEPG